MSFFDRFRKTNKKALSKKLTDNEDLQIILESAMESTADSYNKGEFFFQKGLQAYQYKDYIGAINQFNESIKHADHISGVYINRGGTFQFLERYLEARDDYLKAIEIESADPSEDHNEIVQAAMQNLRVIERYCNFSDQKGDTLISQIESDGLPYAAKRYGEIICKKLDQDKDTVSQFILEELEELDELGGRGMEFALQSGINRGDYLKAVESNTRKEVHDEVSHLLKSILCCLSRTPESMLEFRTTLLDTVMQMYCLGKYDLENA